MCFQLNLVLSGIHIINRPNKKLVYSFQTLTLPFFTSLYNDWYKLIDNNYYKVLPLNLDSLFTPADHSPRGGWRDSFCIFNYG